MRRSNVNNKTISIGKEGAFSLSNSGIVFVGVKVLSLFKNLLPNVQVQVSL